MLPRTPEPLGTPAAAGAEPERKVTVLPLTERVSPSAGWALPIRPVAVAAPLAIRVMAPVSAAAPSPAVAVAPWKEPITPPSVLPALAACAPPAVPSVRMLLLAEALVKVVVTRRALAVAQAIVGETFDLVE